MIVCGHSLVVLFNCFVFFFDDPATPEVSTLSLRAALPICRTMTVMSVIPEVNHPDIYNPLFLSTLDDTLGQKPGKHPRKKSDYINLHYCLIYFSFATYMPLRHEGTKKRFNDTITTF